MEREEFEAIYAEHGQRLLRIAVVVLGGRDGAEDAVAEAFARCWRRWRSHRPDDPGAYLRRTLLNELVRQGERAARRGPSHATTVVRDETSGVVDRLLALEVLAELPARQRAVLACRFLDDRTEAETAQLLSMPVGTVKSTTSRALARLNDLLGTDYAGDGDAPVAVDRAAPPDPGGGRR
ncbi:sigma-70 family RNA polymerase sigma factor [Dermatobacter hominis]|uniref:sigma-70 family RNA polymerase sigma factor n=1 Tax=Dermatobacter hominis TaxID=2884263 RepID=UPI001D115107|nr:sigma-70 family RNA polymerase sigma factor [Dermatobacter hominis]UDY35887.1 sigma-70 family RNA polymerase sigma factor [Dermatobacter hominis]